MERTTKTAKSRTSGRSTSSPCAIAEQTMLAMAAGDLAPGEDASIAAHIAECPECAKSFESWKALDQTLTNWDRRQSSMSAPSTKYGIIDSPVGSLHIAVSEKGVCEIGFGANESLAEFRARLTDRGFTATEDETAIAPVADELRDYFAGRRTSFDLPVDLTGTTEFTQAVLSACSQVPFGRLDTYLGIARGIGKPGATRAVGSALGRNPVPIIIPCHRVIASGGRIGGYNGGLAIKQRLLALEGAALA